MDRRTRPIAVAARAVEASNLGNFIAFPSRFGWFPAGKRSGTVSRSLFERLLNSIVVAFRGWCRAKRTGASIEILF